MENVRLPKFSERLKALRKEKRRTQVEMAELFGWTEAHYQKVEYGWININDLGTFGRLFRGIHRLSAGQE